MKNYLIQLNGASFFTAAQDGVPFGTPYPSQGQLFDYDEADRLARDFRDKGYASLVTDSRGQPVTAADLVSLKAAVEYQVMFSGHYFVRANAHGREEGSPDRSLALAMPQAVALEIARKLRRAGHLDATIIEANSPVVDTQMELNKIWPNQAK